MTKSNRVVRLKRRPAGQVAADDFAILDEPLAEPKDGEIRVRIAYVSLDPAMRGWISEGRSYVEPVAVGDVMRAYAAGHVELSRNPRFAVGDAVTGLLGVQSHAVSDGRGVIKVDEQLAPLPSWLGGLGMPGHTAYFGLKHVADVKPGETVVVSAASGAVGQVVGQIAKIEGARAVGIAGGPEKCAFITRDLGFDAAVDHKRPDLSDALKAAAPQGIDVDFENVGGDVFDAVLARMNQFGRVALCGLISAYNATEPPPAPRNLRFVLTMRLKVQGFIVFDFAKQYKEATSALLGWYRDGRLKLRE
ncbi:MAG TPA: NADP-dependent oxidoreductase, partial [Aestuariivirgaceae bacterium]|nr:NADP-dependent oxidoreductase [Aestuariivirgaceae bacterium]